MMGAHTVSCHREIFATLERDRGRSASVALRARRGVVAIWEYPMIDGYGDAVDTPHEA